MTQKVNFLASSLSFSAFSRFSLSAADSGSVLAGSLSFVEVFGAFVGASVGAWASAVPLVPGFSAASFPRLPGHPGQLPGVSRWMSAIMSLATSMVCVCALRCGVGRAVLVLEYAQSVRVYQTSSQPSYTTS